MATKTKVTFGIIGGILVLAGIGGLGFAKYTEFIGAPIIGALCLIVGVICMVAVTRKPDDFGATKAAEAVTKAEVKDNKTAEFVGTAQHEGVYHHA
jgi:sugar phosphate permease